jgi:hypothetical protein
MQLGVCWTTPPASRKFLASEIANELLAPVAQNSCSWSDLWSFLLTTVHHHLGRMWKQAEDLLLQAVGLRTLLPIGLTTAGMGHPQLPNWIHEGKAQHLHIGLISALSWKPHNYRVANCRMRKDTSLDVNVRISPS